MAAATIVADFARAELVPGLGHVQHHAVLVERLEGPGHAGGDPGQEAGVGIAVGIERLACFAEVADGKFAQDADIPFSNYASLTRATEVQELIQSEIDRVNKKFARVEQIKKFFLLDTQLTAEDEELTPTMKLKRKLVEQKYAPQIEAMY
jgi:hypothetical protein